MLVSLTPSVRRPALEARLAPYLRAFSPAAREYLARETASPIPVLGLYFGAFARLTLPVLFTVFGSPQATSTRLRQAGWSQSAQEFRSIQFACAVGGCLVGAALAAVVALGDASPLIQGAIVLALLVAPLIVSERLLQRAAARRLARMSSELPTVLEFLTLSLSAGEGIVDAIRRVSVVSSGELAAELSTTFAVVSSGVPLTDALGSMAKDLDFVPFTRFVEQIDGALERGTPLAEVLRAQAHDARDEAKRELLESAGKKEVAMLFPLVFLILPTTIAFAIFPGVVVLQTGF